MPHDPNEHRKDDELSGGPTAPVRERHPAGLPLLFVTEMWERFSYYGMRAILVLYMLTPLSSDQPNALEGGLGWTERIAGPVYGWYTALVFLLPLWGGMLADKLLGTHRSMVIGGLIIIAGHTCLAFMGLFEPGSNATIVVFFAGLALVIVGTGFFKPCVSVMVGQLYRQGDPRRDAGFTFFYMGINIGAFAGILGCGYLGESVGWHWGFGAAGVGMALGLIVYLIGRPALLADVGLPPKDPAPIGRTLSTILGTMAAVGVVVVLYVCLTYLGETPIEARYGWMGWADWLDNTWAKRLEIATIIGATIVVLLIISLFIAAQSSQERGPTLALFIIAFFVLFFWLAFEQAGSSLNQFAMDRTDRNIFGNWLFPASWLQSVNPLMILIFAPLFASMWTGLARRRRDPNIAIKIGIGLLFVGAGFGLMVFAGIKSDGGASLSTDTQPILVGWWWLGGMYVMHTWGELCLSPIGLSLTTKLAPRKWVSLMMGVWFLAPAVAQLIGGYTFGAVKEIQQAGVLGVYGIGGYFLLFVLVGVIPGVTIILLTPLMKRLIGDRA
ncbi:MAG: peptide MFS transporter [Deltaproteobacteria bacterium]|jgi:POT family proton-dependent oligopeptide transporter|nr:peptide MFS transporter [Deltaproteobacteria bacterium]